MLSLQTPRGAGSLHDAEARAEAGEPRPGGDGGEDTDTRPGRRGGGDGEYTCTVHLYCTLLFINRFCDPGGVHRGQDGAAASLYQAGRQATPASKKGIRILENKHFNDSCELLRFRLP